MMHFELQMKAKSFYLISVLHLTLSIVSIVYRDMIVNVLQRRFLVNGPALDWFKCYLNGRILRPSV